MLGAIIVVGVVLYFSFTTVDGFALGDQRGKAAVVGKEYREAKRTYSTEIIGGKSRPIPRMVPEMYILKLKFNDEEAEFSAKKDLYDAVKVGDQVQIIYQRRRITGAIKIIEVTR
jgi:hypothetical protein